MKNYNGVLKLWPLDCWYFNRAQEAEREHRKLEIQAERERRRLETQAERARVAAEKRASATAERERKKAAAAAQRQAKKEAADVQRERKKEQALKKPNQARKREEDSRDTLVRQEEPPVLQAAPTLPEEIHLQEADEPAEEILQFGDVDQGASGQATAGASARRAAAKRTGVPFYFPVANRSRGRGRGRGGRGRKRGGFARAHAMRENSASADSVYISLLPRRKPSEMPPPAPPSSVMSPSSSSVYHSLPPPSSVQSSTASSLPPMSSVTSSPDPPLVSLARAVTSAVADDDDLIEPINMPGFGDDEGDEQESKENDNGDQSSFAEALSEISEPNWHESASQVGANPVTRAMINVSAFQFAKKVIFLLSVH
jgi:hypothetical protein